MSRRIIGILAISVAAALAGALIGWSVLSGSEQTDDRSDAKKRLEQQMGPAPVINDQVQAFDEMNVEDVLDEAGGVRIQGLDPDQSGRVAYEIFYDRSEPLRAGRLSIEGPEAWLYFDEGSAAQVVADEGTLVMPAGTGQPESGRFRGNVVIRIFLDAPGVRGAQAKASEGKGPADDEAPAPAAKPVATIEAESLGFDTAIGEISTTSAVRIAGAGFDVELQGLKILLDEPGERIAYLGSQRGGIISVDPSRLADGGASDRTERNDEARADAGGAEETGAGVETIYALELVGSLELTSGARTLTADRLDAWARLIDGALPPDAIATIVAPEPAATGKDRRADARESAPASETSSPFDEPVTLQWSGPLTLRPAEEEPDALRADDLALALTSPESRSVRLEDGVSGASVECIEISAGLTRGVATLAGRGETGVTIVAPDAARLSVGRLELDARSGLATLEGRAQVEAIGNAASPPGAPPFAEPLRRTARWANRATISLATRDGMLDLGAAPLVESAVVEGDVAGAWDGIDVRSDHLRTDFTESPDGGAAPSRVILTGGVEIDAGADGELATERLDVSFASDDSGALRPRFATATGRVRAGRDGARLTAELAEVALGPGEDDRLALERFSAEREVVIEREGGFSALADSLRLDAGAEIAEVRGEPAVLRYGEASLTAGSMRIEQTPRRLSCFGAGVLNHSRLREGALGYERVQVEWNESMVYDDDAGRAEFIGSCVATAETTDLARDVAEAHRFVVDVTPGLTREVGAGAGERAAAAIDSAPAPELQRVRAIGAALETVSDDRVEIESRRYVLDSESPTGLRLSRLFYIEGDELTADAQRNELEIPGPGRILIEHRPASSPGDAEPEVDLAGTTLFEWRGALRLDRAEGDAEMTNRVRLRHKPLGSQRVTDLECERLSASLATDGEEAPRDSACCKFLVVVNC